MLDESAYLPRECASLPKGPWLVLAPHPDDESFGMGGTLLLAKSLDITVDILFVTNGAAANPDDKTLVSTREQEAKRCCDFLGIKEIWFWGEQDRALNASEQLIERLSNLINQYRYASVFFPSIEEPHPDHRVTAILAWQSLRRCHFLAQGFSYDISVQSHTNTLIDISAVVAEKKQLMAYYQSQLLDTPYIERILGLNQSRAWSLAINVTHAEAFYHWPKQDRSLNALSLSLMTQRCSLQALPNLLPKVSVITRTQNRPHFLSQAIRSIASQLYSNIELIVVNDGGSHCQAIVEQEAIGAIQNFIYKHLDKQQGRAHAANVGLSLAKGEYICFLDDDDLLAVEHIENLVSYAQHYNYSVVYADTKVVMINNQGLESEVDIYQTEFSKPRLLFNNFLPIHSVLFERKLLKNEVSFDTSFDFFEDWDFWLQLSQCSDFFHLAKTTAIYRLHENASGVHQTNNSSPYFKIYDKWLSSAPIDTLCLIFQNSHQWHEDVIASLSERYSAKLDTIGTQHENALQTLQARDQRLQQLNSELDGLGKEHSYAVKTIAERDQALQQLNSELDGLGKEHSYAVKIIEERDQQLHRLNNQLDCLGKEHSYALEIIKKRDEQLYNLNQDYEKIIDMLDGRDKQLQALNLELNENFFSRGIKRLLKK